MPSAQVRIESLNHLKYGKANETRITGVAAVMCSYNRYEVTFQQRSFIVVAIAANETAQNQQLGWLPKQLHDELPPEGRARLPGIHSERLAGDALGCVFRSGRTRHGKEHIVAK